MTEAEFQANVIDLAKTLGWRIHHDRGDYRQCIAGDPGFPDLVLAKDGRVLFLELKSEKGKMTEAQGAWFGDLPLQHAYLVYPTDMQEIAKLLGPVHAST